MIWRDTLRRVRDSTLVVVVPSGQPNAGIHPHWTTKVFLDFSINLGHDQAYPSEEGIPNFTPSAAWGPEF